MYWWYNCLGKLLIGVVLVVAIVVACLFAGVFPRMGFAPFSSSYHSTSLLTDAPQAIPIPSNYADAPYVTPDGTVICSGNVSVRTPDGRLYVPDSDPTTGEVVGITGSGYTIFFTNSASCTQYPRLSPDQVNSMLDRLIEQQQTPGSGACGYRCTGDPQKWVFSS